MERGRLYVGTSGWYYDDWPGEFYPPDLPPSGWLSYYAQHFPTVEINATFYRLPFRNMVKGWHDKAPAGFLYAVKGHRRITHLKKLLRVHEDVELFFDRVRPLEEHLGPILWQLPPSLKKDARRLESFLKALPTDCRHAIEFRDPSWLCEEVFECLRAHRVAHVSISSRRMPADFTVTADFAYVRFHGLRGGYAHDYTAEELKPWAEHVRRQLAEGRDVFAYFNNDVKARAVKNARDLMRLAGGRSTG